MSQRPSKLATSPTRPSANGGKLDWILLAAIAIACLLRVVYIDGRELWYDEVLSLLLSTTQRISYGDPAAVPIALANYSPLLQLPPLDSVSDILKGIKPLFQGLVGREPHPPLFFLCQYLWLLVTNNQAIALRSLNLLLSLGAIFGAYGMGKALFNQRGGLVFAALLGLNPFFWFHSLNVRMYCPTVLWVTLAGWAGVQLCYQRPVRRLGWYVLLTLAMAAGILTYYLSALAFVALGVVFLIQDRQRWWHYGLCGLGAVGLASPWIYWGVPQQLRNVDLQRFANNSSWLETMVQHIQGILELLGIQLAVGDWATGLPTAFVLGVGVLVSLGLALMIGQLWHLLRHRSMSLLLVVLSLGCLPLLLMLGFDILSGQSTLAWGFGRTGMFILPGLLLLITAWIVHLPHRWQMSAIATLLAVYLGLNGADMALRQRQVFQQIAATATPAESTLIAMNSKAWGHVLRLVYYFPAETPVKLLATDPAMLPDALNDALATAEYDQVLWLEAMRPVWKAPKADEAEQIRQDIEARLGAGYTLANRQELVGTMQLDRFSLAVYEK